MLLQVACRCPELKAVLDKLASLRLSPLPVPMLGHLASAMLNFFKIPACERLLNAGWVGGAGNGKGGPREPHST